MNGEKHGWQTQLTQLVANSITTPESMQCKTLAFRCVRRRSVSFKLLHFANEARRHKSYLQAPATFNRVASLIRWMRSNLIIADKNVVQPIRMFSVVTQFFPSRMSECRWKRKKKKTKKKSSFSYEERLSVEVRLWYRNILVSKEAPRVIPLSFSLFRQTIPSRFDAAGYRGDDDSRLPVDYGLQIG